MPEKAIRYYNLAYKLNPNNLMVLALYTDYLLFTKHYEKCIQICTEVEKTHGTKRVIVNAIANAARRAGKYQLARDKFEFMNIYYPSDTTTAFLAESYLNLAKSVHSKEYLTGYKLVQEALDINKNNKITLFVAEEFIKVAQKAFPDKIKYPIDLSKQPMPDLQEVKNRGVKKPLTFTPAKKANTFLNSNGTKQGAAKSFTMATTLNDIKLVDNMVKPVRVINYVMPSGVKGTTRTWALSDKEKLSFFKEALIILNSLDTQTFNAAQKKEHLKKLEAVKFGIKQLSY